MKLLLDAMFPPDLAAQLRRPGHDVSAAAERPGLDKLLDPDLFAAAQAEQRTVVTENSGDFLQLDAPYRDPSRSHYGLILTTNRRFPRSRKAIGRLVRALDAFLRTQPSEPRAESLIHWLR